MSRIPQDLSQAEDDADVLAVVEQYHAELTAGRRPSRNAYLERYPELASRLAQYLDGLDMIQAAASQLQPPTAPRQNAAPEITPELPLGDYRIVREIGRGGMGTVYEAVQLSLGRPVALKVLPFAAAIDAKCLQRFKNEAQAAAQLHHTNIVPVYAVGCERGVHFYAMQLIDGQPLTTFIAQMRKLAPRPPESKSSLGSSLRHAIAAEPGTLDVLHSDELVDGATREPAPMTTAHASCDRGYFRTVARLGIQAAEALDHAHQMGVVHRDVKPANLLLDGRGNLWVTDFGLAQFQADANLTRTGDILGTLRYMSPEQAAGDRVVLDHRTDIYSLGVTLYELLTLRPAFTGSDQLRLLAHIRDDEPPAPRTIDRSIPVELETIVLKALSKSPADRYQTARALADDLDRYLHDKPILARRPSLLDRTRKWARRHPSVVWAGVVVLMLSVAGLIVSNWMISGERAKAVARADEAERRFKQAREAVDLLIQVSEQELANRPDLQDVYKRLLEVGLVNYQEFIEQRRDDPRAQAELAKEKKRLQELLADFATLQGAQHSQLLEAPDVRTDLRLEAEQKQAVESLLTSWRDQRMGVMEEFRKLSAEERRQKFVKLAREQEKGLAIALNPDQIRRLRQIAIQTKGVFAFHMQEVIDALRLTEDQRKRIRALETEAFAPPFPGPGPGPGKPPEPPQGKPPDKDGPGGFLGRMANMQERVLEILTLEQRQRWQELVGEPFRGRAGPHFHFRPPGPKDHG